MIAVHFRKELPNAENKVAKKVKVTTAWVDCNFLRKGYVSSEKRKTGTSGSNLNIWDRGL